MVKKELIACSKNKTKINKKKNLVPDKLLTNDSVTTKKQCEQLTEKTTKLQR